MSPFKSSREIIEFICREIVASNFVFLHHVHFVFKLRENRKWITHRDFMRFRAIWVYGVSKSNVKLSHPEWACELLIVIC